VTCDEILRDADGLAALPPDDPERALAFAHAADCPGCVEALQRGSKLAALLDALPPPEAPPPVVLARVAAEIRAETERANVLSSRATAAAVAVAWVVLLVFSRHHGGSSTWIGGALLGLGAVAVALLGVRVGGYAALGAAAVSVAFTLAVGHGGDLEPDTGLHCFLSELISAGVALGVTLWVRSRQGELSGVGLLAAVTAAGALAGQAALNVVCSTRDALPHLLAFHSGGVLAAAAIGALIGSLRGSKVARGIG